MITTIIIVLIVLYALGSFGPSDSGYRTYGGPYVWPGLGAILTIVVILLLLRVI